ncbi:MAG: hypothetical protein PHQ23_13205 [Candidatus Wallbacteria bacterium]|nr:hypothetical protein [Candidatus Wallbacteria bacterium]
MKKIKEVSRALIEVWEWKEKAGREMQGKNFRQKKACLKKSLDEAIMLIGGTLKKNPDGSFIIV